MFFVLQKHIKMDESGILDRGPCKKYQMIAAPMFKPATLDVGVSMKETELSSSPESPLLGYTPDSSISSVSADLALNKSTLSQEIFNSFTHNVTDTVLSAQSNLLVADFSTSLRDDSKITMLPNFNISPTGQEQGDFLCIDLGGSTLRVSVVTIDPPSPQDVGGNADRIHVIIEKQWSIANDFKTIDNAFFKYIASKINETLAAQDVIDVSADSPVIKTGITWSFPLKTTSHNNGKIVHVSKGYSISDEIYDRDLKTILESVLAADFGLSVDIKIVINDSLAVYSAGSFMDKYMKLAMVLGTGFNMCCSLQNTDDIHESKRWSNHSSVNKTLFNTELSLFGDQMLPYLPNKYDYIIEPRFENFQFNFKPYMEEDPVAGSILQPTELMTSGRYLPELARLVLTDLIHAKEIFASIPVDLLDPILNQQFDGINGELFCFIAETSDISLIRTRLCIFYDWPSESLTNEDLSVLKSVIECITRRGAFIVAISIVAFIKLLQQNQSDALSKTINIGYVGSLIQYFNSYRELIKTFINGNDAIKKMGITVDFKLVENSSIIGAAIGAAYYS